MFRHEHLERLYQRLRAENRRLLALRQRGYSLREINALRGGKGGAERIRPGPRRERPSPDDP